jgi:hypothetical protein
MEAAGLKVVPSVPLKRISPNFHPPETAPKALIAPSMVDLERFKLKVAG